MVTTSPEIHKVLTFKSGNFVFSRRFDHQKIETELKVFHACYDIIASLPMLPNFAAYLDKELIRKSIFSTAALEGNPLGQEEVNELISKGNQVIAPDDFETEILNLKNAHDKYILSPKGIAPLLLSEDLIKEAHAAITNGVNDQTISPGIYRNTSVKVGNEEHGGTYIPPKILEDIKTLMGEFILWINSDELLKIDPIIRAALAHYHLAKIHPFRDGNGRTARMIEAMILASTGYKYIPSTLWNYYYLNIHEYYIAYTKAEKNEAHNVQPFLAFFLDSLRSSLKELQNRIINSIKPILVRDFAAYLKDNTRELTSRQYNLLDLLLSNHVEFDHHFLKTTMPYKILYQAVSEKTIKRDLQKLEHFNLLTKDNGKYRINYDFL